MFLYGSGRYNSLSGLDISKLSDLNMAHVQSGLLACQRTLHESEGPFPESFYCELDDLLHRYSIVIRFYIVLSMYSLLTHS
jgi:hypothetical protein